MNVTSIPPADPFFGVAPMDPCTAQVQPGHDGQRLKSGSRVDVTGLGMLGLVFLSVAGLGGCHLSTSFLDNKQFMEAWSTYLHCRESSQPDEIRVDLQQLTGVSNRHAESLHNHSSILLLPGAMRSLVATLPSRVAVDPHAMASACALHGGTVAQAKGQPLVSEELLTHVVEAQEGSTSAYYTVQAVHGLKRVKQDAHTDSTERNQ